MHTSGTWTSCLKLISSTCWNQVTDGLFFLSAQLAFKASRLFGLPIEESFDDGAAG